jgi:hypothetical protein
MGNGSGTGTGGTVQYLDAEPLDMWMGVWSPRVYHFSSNWKEMRTLLATLEQAKATRRTDIANVTFFYFTGNIVTYFAVTAGSSRSPGLHSMVEEIKKLEIELGITLEAVHVPSTTIIEERTDGLSRGVWSSALHQRHDRLAILTEIFAPVPYTAAVLAWDKNQAGLAPATVCHHLPWDLDWQPADILNRLTLWTPPPEIAAQLLFFLLQLYVEQPLSTSMLILAPRILQRRWMRLSRFILKIGVYPRVLIPAMHRLILTIPVVLLYIPPHVRHLGPPRLDAAPTTSNRYLHRQHAAFVRGLPAAP